LIAGYVRRLAGFAATARPTKAALSEIAKCSWIFVASRQCDVVTPKASSIASERRHPRMTDTAVARCGCSSWRHDFFTDGAKMGRNR